ncbi:EAL domain-containing protein [Massilia sp. IC2-476]|uniref:two-component system response regulator n=1 Tax=Massilia sp. IC2-476 TaxID=2887199 RepID=UPI001D124361|nr:EAL domain-containing protein [Massilia sp. IC2-476]MCC2972179.1 EAL domain-containing protein [Massilia sp. IC2-476]
MATILIVDDRPSNRAFLNALLGFTGHRLLEAHDGAQALALARRERPDLVITDLLMPIMDGYELVQQLRGDDELRGIRVIFFSAVYAEREIQAMAARCGVATVLPKPADPQQILDAIQAELGVIEGAPPLPVPQLAAEGDRALPFDLGARLAELERMCLSLIGERRVETLAASFLDAARRVLHADCAALCLLDRGERNVRHLDTWTLDPALLASHALDESHLPGMLLRARAPLRLAAGDAMLDSMPSCHPPMGSFLGLQVHDLQHPHGWLYCARRPGAPAFTDEEERWATALAAQLAVAYENLNLYDVVQRHAAQLQLEALARADADKALRESEHRLELARQVFDSTQEGIMMTDADANIVAVNPAFEQITGYRESEVLGLSPRMLRSGRHDATFYRDMWHCLEKDGQWRGEIWNRRKNGEVYPERTSISAVRDEAGKLTAYVSVSTDLSALKAAHHQLDFLSNHDALTLLPNRSLFNDRLQQAIAAARQGDGQLALLLFNVDRLSRINDSLGHAAGDAVLREVAQRVGDIAGPTDTLARLSGDEFVLLLTSCDDNEDIILAARRLIDAIARPFVLGGHDVVVTGSVGISIFPRDGNAPGDLLKAADAALGDMKKSGRNGFRFFKGEMNAQALRWLALETRLRRAIERDELALHYQPQISRIDGSVVGMEALLRWRSEEMGSVSPGDFIPLAEDTGLIHPIGEWVIRQACFQNKAWQNAGLPPVKMAVNVSANQFKAGSVSSMVRKALLESGLAPRYLEVELTESVMLGDSAVAEAQMAELRAMGVSLSLDDFGTGYSSLGYLSRFPLDKLKIDQTFVRNITTEQRSAAIAQATIALAQGLSLSVVAEGVETIGQRDFLGLIGCDVMQGYLYSRPVPSHEMAQLLAKGRVAV